MSKEEIEKKTKVMLVLLKGISHEEAQKIIMNCLSEVISSETEITKNALLANPFQ